MAFCTRIFVILCISICHVFGENSVKEKVPFPHFFTQSSDKISNSNGFILRYEGGTVLFDKESVNFRVFKIIDDSVVKTEKAVDISPRQFLVENVILSFPNSNSSTILIGNQPLSSHTNYFIGSDESKWQTNLPNFSELFYKNLYEGIDLKYYVEKGALKYDFIISPGASLSGISMKYDGIKSVGIDSIGKLKIQTNFADIFDYIPECYQIIDGNKVQVKVNFVQKDRNIIGFEASDYNQNYALVIDPLLVYSTFVGGSQVDYEYTGGISLDVADNIYVTGRTFSNDFPSTPGVVQVASGGSMDAFVFKLDATGSNLIFSTFIGGSDVDAGYATKIDPITNDIYLAGTTASFNFPTTVGAYQTVFGGGLFDAFVLKLNASGNSLIYSSLIGNGYDDYGAGIDIDILGNAYLVGQSDGPFPVTIGAYQTTFGGGPWDIFITKFNSTGSNIFYSTLIGGPLEDHCHSIQVDGNYNVHIAGFTTGGFPTTPGSYDQSYNGGQWDNYVAKLNAFGSSLIFSTYVGGPGADWTWNGLEIDSMGFSYVTGYAQAGFPVTSGAFQTTYGGGAFDVYVYKLSPSGNNLVFSTYIGGTGEDQGWGLFLGQQNDVFITGLCQYGYPYTQCSYDTTISGSYDAFVTHLDQTGSSLLFSSYIGGSQFDKGFNIIVENKIAFVAGSTMSVDFPVTSTAFDTVFNGDEDIVVFKLDMNVTAGGVNAAFSGPDSGCVSEVLQFSNYSSGTNLMYFWDFGDGTTSNLMNPAYAWSAPGVYTVSLIATSSCNTPDTSTFLVSVYSVISDFIFNEPCDLTVSFSNLSLNAVGFVWNFGDGFSSTDFSPTHLYTSSGVYTVELISFGFNGCSDTLSTTIYVDVSATSQFTVTQYPCLDTLSFINLSRNAGSFLWSFGDGSVDTSQNPTHFFSSSGVFNVFLIADPWNCPDTSFHVITIEPKPNSNFSVDFLCDMNVELINNSNAAVSYSWNFGDGSSSGAQSPSHTYTVAGLYTISLVAMSISGCRDSSYTTVTIDNHVVALFSIPDSICGNQVSFNNLSSGAGMYLWDFGDGNIGYDESPIHHYPGPGIFDVKLIAQTGICSDTLTRKIYLNAKPAADFTYSGECTLGIEFKNTSFNSYNVLWNFGNGSSSTLDNPFHYFDSNGIYSVTLEVTSAVGCRNSITKSVPVIIRSDADFSISFDSCSRIMHFLNLSENTTDVVWLFDDGQMSKEVNASRYYGEAGVYGVVLITNHDSPCSDSVKSVFSIPGDDFNYLFIPNSFTPNADGINDCFQIFANEQCWNYKLDIINRWGEVIYSNDKVTECWNGTFEGNLVQPGVYCYLLTNSTEQKKGIINVIY